MTFSHKLKLIFAHLRWMFKAEEERMRYVKRYIDFLYIKDLFIITQKHFLEAHRTMPSDPDTYKLKGKVELLEKIIDEGWN